MKRTPMTRGTTPKLTRKPMARSRARLAPVSKKRRALDRTDTVRAEVRRRSGGRCEVALRAIIGPGNIVEFSPPFIRCPMRATDLCHLRKPRRSAANHTAALTFHACRGCHNRQGEQQPYVTGRIVVTPHGDGTFTFTLVYAESKFTLRAAKEIAQ